MAPCVENSPLTSACLTEKADLQHLNCPRNFNVRGLAEVIAQDAIQDALYACCASDETIQVRAESEDKSQEALINLLNSGSKGLNPELRTIVAWFMAHVCESMCLPENLWFDMVTLLDVYSLRSPAPVRVGDLPALCGALVRLLKKMETVQFLPNEDHLLSLTNQLAAYLRQGGHDVAHPAVTLDSLEAQEKLVLKTLDWNIHLSSVNTWMAAFYARMNTLTGQVLLPSLRVTWSHSMSVARTMLLQSGASLSFSRRHSARGLLGLAFVALRLLRPEDLGLDSSDDMEGIFIKQPSDASQTSPIASCSPPIGVADGPIGTSKVASSTVDHSQFFLELLQVATGSDLEGLMEDCELIYNELRNHGRSRKQEHYMPREVQQVHYESL
jgi:hypothetical protein